MKNKAKRELTKKQLTNLAKGRANLAAKQEAREKQKAKLLDALAVPEPKEKPALKAKQRGSFNGKKIGMIMLGASLLGVSIIFALVWWADTTQTLFGLATVIFFAGGLLVLMMSLKKLDVTANRPSLRHGGEKQTGPANSITIYAKKDPANPAHLLPERIAFEQLDNPPGLKRKLRNDGKYYYLNINDTTGLKDCVLPDNQYCDPRRMLIPFLMKYSQEYYTPVPTLLQRIKPLLFLLIVGIGGVILAMVNTPTPPGG